MARTIGLNCVVMYNLIKNTHARAHYHTQKYTLFGEDQCELHRMTRMTGPGWAVMSCGGPN